MVGPAAVGVDGVVHWAPGSLPRCSRAGGVGVGSQRSDGDARHVAQGEILLPSPLAVLCWRPVCPGEIPGTQNAWGLLLVLAAEIDLAHWSCWEPGLALGGEGWSFSAGDHRSTRACPGMTPGKGGRQHPHGIPEVLRGSPMERVRWRCPQEPSAFLLADAATTMSSGDPTWAWLGQRADPASQGLDVLGAPRNRGNRMHQPGLVASPTSSPPVLQC